MNLSTPHFFATKLKSCKNNIKNNIKVINYTFMANLFKDKEFWKTTVKLTTPVALQNLLTSSFSLVDTLFVSSLGTAALSAVGMAGQWVWLMTMLIVGFCSAATVFVSQFWGVKNINKIRRVSGISIIFVIVAALIFTCSALFAPQGVIRLFNSEEQVISAGSEYLVIVAFSYMPIALTNILAAVLRDVERVKLPMYASLATTVLNIFLDYCLIFGKFGFVKMGIKGAAVATVASAWLGLAVIVIVSFIERNVLVARLKEFFVFSKSELVFYLKKAAPVVLNESMWGLGTFVFNMIFGHMGYEYFSALTIVRSFENMAFVLFVGVCSASSVMIGKSIGQGNIKQGLKDSKRFSIIVPVLAVIISSLIIIFRNQLVSLFNTGGSISRVTVETAAVMMIIYACAFPFRMFPFLQIVSIFRSGGDTFTGAKFELLCLWALSVPATLAAVYIFKVPFLVAYAVMFVFEDIPKVIFCLKFYFSKKWIKPVTEEGKAGFKEYMKEIGEKSE